MTSSPNWFIYFKITKQKYYNSLIFCIQYYCSFLNIRICCSRIFGISMPLKILPQRNIQFQIRVMILMEKNDTIGWIFIAQSMDHSVKSVCFLNALAILWKKSMKKSINYMQGINVSIHNIFKDFSPCNLRIEIKNDSFCNF